ncbi:MAG: 60S ribosomal protein L22 [Candidatus Bathyarchaeia archaeon]|nr:60S ribosomal protein L22 [Candidatus Bathyarchaeota archaeon]
MGDIRIDISELKVEGDELVKELADFLNERTGIETEKTPNEIILKTGEKGVSKQYLRVLLRKFLHKSELKDHFRVISGKENSLIIKGRRTSEMKE